MPVQMLFQLLLMALFGGYTLWVKKKRKARMGPAFRMYRDRWGPGLASGGATGAPRSPVQTQLW